MQGRKTKAARPCRAAPGSATWPRMTRAPNQSGVPTLQSGVPSLQSPVPTLQAGMQMKSEPVEHEMGGEGNDINS